MLTRDELPDCPWATAIRLIGNKWKLFILRDLYLYPVCRFGQLKKSIAGISSRVLTENLRALEQDQIVIRTVYPGQPPRVEYQLSQMGNTLIPLIQQLGDWGREYQKMVQQNFPESME